MALYRILETNAAAYFKHDSIRYSVISDGNPNKPIFVVQKKKWWGWSVLDWEYSYLAAERVILRDQGKAPAQLAYKEAKEKQPIVVAEFD